MRRFLSAVLLVAVLAGCGGGTTQPTERNFFSAKDLATALECVNYESQPEAVARGDVGICQFNGEQITTLVAGSTEDRDANLDFARNTSIELGVTPQPYTHLVGGTWAVLTETARTAELAKAKVGGEVR